MKEKMMRIIVAVMLALLLCSLTLQAGAASKNDWKLNNVWQKPTFVW